MSSGLKFECSSHVSNANKSDAAILQSNSAQIIKQIDGRKQTTGKMTGKFGTERFEISGMPDKIADTEDCEGGLLKSDQESVNETFGSRPRKLIR